MIDRNFVANLSLISSDINEYLLSLYNVPVQMNAQKIVEIGAGVSTFALVAAANKTGGHVISIDVGGPDTLNRVSNGKKIMAEEERFTMITGNSLGIAILDFPIDFFFLDSEHTYDLTKAEIERWFPLVRKGGVISMHDTAHETGQAMGARQALNEYLGTHPNEYVPVHLLDTKIIGMTFLTKL